MTVHRCDSCGAEKPEQYSVSTRVSKFLGWFRYESQWATVELCDNCFHALQQIAATARNVREA